MEAVPKLPLISFELKTAIDPSYFGPKLKHYISEGYREDPESYNNEIYELESLRSSAVRPTLDHDGLKVLIRYFCQLRAMQSRFPMAKGQPAACSFSWKDLYANLNCVLPDIRYEMASILYNIGALHSLVGSSEPRNSPESLKAACTHFQNAAWAFLYVREHFTQPTGVDVSAEIMRLLQEICFAQAQECILDKSIQDTKKPSVVGAVATQVVYFYKNALALLGPSSGTDSIHDIIGSKLYKYWHHYLSFKTFYIGSIVCLYQGLNAEEQQKMGERVAYYQLAVDKLNEARKLSKYIEPVKIALEALTFTNDVVEGKRKAAKNENEYIYHEEVPDKDLLTDLKPVCLVKALPIDLNNREVSGPDIFARLVPMGAHEASSLYSEEKAKLLRKVVGEAETKNTEFTEFMSSLQLDQLEVLDADQKIPQEIVDRCAAMNAKTEVIQSLIDSMNNLAEIISDVEHSLGEIKSYIQEETMKEKDYQKIMGPRPPSIVQTELSREFHKYQEAHTRTNESNQVLHKAMTLHIANLRLLAQPLDVLQSKIPSIDNIEGLDRDIMMEMRRVVGKARQMQQQRNAFLDQLRESINADDITSQLLARSSEPTEEIFKQEIEKHTPHVKLIEQNLAAQENIINRLTSLYASYADSRRMLSDVLRKREALINALITSYDTYEELLGKSQKGLEFYKKLSLNVNQLLTRLKGTCQVQEEERSQLLSKQSAPAPARSISPATNTVKTPDSTLEPTSGSGGPLKLKDYLPYMKNRGIPRNIPPQAQMEALPTEAYYPESIYPTSIRPAPLGSEAADLTQMLPDGVAMPHLMRNNLDSYHRDAYNAQYKNEPYAVTSNNYPTTSKGYEIPQDGNYAYSTSYIPNQFSSQGCAESQYANPYYSGTQNNTTSVTNSPNMQYNNDSNQSGLNVNTQYNANVYSDSLVYGQRMGLIQDNVTSISGYNTTVNVNQDLNAPFAQMQVTPKSEPTTNFVRDYSQTYYNMQYPQTSTPNMAATYSHAPQNSRTSMVPSQVPSGYNSLNYPYSSDPVQIQYEQQEKELKVPNIGNVADQSNQTGISHMPCSANPASHQYSMMNQYSYEGTIETLSQGYIYTNADSLTTSMTSVISAPQATSVTVNQPYSFPSDTDSINPALLAQLEALDQPIKSHVTGEALSTYPTTYFNPKTINYNNPASVAFINPEQTYQQNTQISPVGGYPNQIEQIAKPTPNLPNSEQTVHTNYAVVESNYSHSGHENHPGYNYNPSTGVYEYGYGSQNACVSHNLGESNESKTMFQDPNWSAPGGYTSAVTYETLQSPSGTSQIETPQGENVMNASYGYLTTTNQSNVIPANSTPSFTNYGADVNLSTSLQSGLQNTNVISTNNQVSSLTMNVAEPPTFDQTDHNSGLNNEAKSSENDNTVSNNVAETLKENKEVKSETKLEPVTETSTIDLLADIDFTVEIKPLMPEIKVPQISENLIIKRPTATAKLKAKLKEDAIERPAKKDIFSDASMLNKFTEEVKKLQKFVDSLTNRTPSGLTVLDSKWKALQDLQAKENSRSKNIAMQHSTGSIVTEVVPYDDSRLTLKSNPDAYINASYYKQLASWCIPLVISNNPREGHNIFWKAVLENKIGCIVCLISEIEMQGKSYWPTAMGHSMDFDEDIKVTLNNVSCTVHWTERKMTVTCGQTAFNVTHYQISVFPAKIACSPLVLLADKVLSLTYHNKLSNQLCGAWIQCESGASRSSVLAVLIMVMCQVRAGQLALCDILDTGCANLYKNRTNMIEDTKFLADAYRTALFFVQGVLFSGTTSFNGETVSMQTGAELIPPVPPTNAAPTNQKPQKFSRESFEEMKQSPGLKSGDMKDPLNFLDPLWSLKKK